MKNDYVETTIEEVIQNAVGAFFLEAQGDRALALRLASERTVNLLAEIGRLQKEVAQLREAREKVLGTND